MNFLTPGLLGMAALAGPIILLYMLRLRRQEVQISSTMLWQQLMQDREANRPWQKLRRNLLLLLQLLILAALVLALARPFIPVPAVAAGSVALLLDASASMASTDMAGGTSRFEAARSQSQAIINDLGGDEVMTIIAVGAEPQVLSPPTSDKTALREALSRAQVSPSPADWNAALALAGASMAGREGASIVIVSDGGLPDDLPALPAQVRYVGVGRSAENLAITALATRPLEGEPQLFAAVTNFGSTDAEVILSIETDGALQTAERLDVPAGQTVNQTITDLPEDTSLIRAELSAPGEATYTDFLPLDDVAYAVYAPPAAGRVLLVSEGNRFLEQVLASFPDFQAFRADPDEEITGQFDLVIYDRTVPEESPRGNIFYIAPPQSTGQFLLGDTFTDTRFVRQASDPILSFVAFDEIAVREAVAIQTPGWGRTLVEAEGGPLLLVGDTQGVRIAVLTFDIFASDLPLRVDFPILLANLFQWFSPAQAFEAPDGLQAGEAVLIRPQATTTEYRVTQPDGSIKRYPVTDESLTFAATTQLGIYEVDLLAGDEAQPGGAFAVNLFSSEESRILPAESITIGETQVVNVNQAPQEAGQRELWPWLAALALLVLIAEWWVYFRGTGLPRLLRGKGEAA